MTLQPGAASSPHDFFWWLVVIVVKSPTIYYEPYVQICLKNTQHLLIYVFNAVLTESDEYFSLSSSDELFYGKDLLFKGGMRA